MCFGYLLYWHVVVFIQLWDHAVKGLEGIFGVWLVSLFVHRVSLGKQTFCGNHAPSKVMQCIDLFLSFSSKVQKLLIKALVLLCQFLCYFFRYFGNELNRNLDCLFLNSFKLNRVYLLQFFLLKLHFLINYVLESRRSAEFLKLIQHLIARTNNFLIWFLLSICESLLLCFCLLLLIYQLLLHVK